MRNSSTGDLDYIPASGTDAFAAEGGVKYLVAYQRVSDKQPMVKVTIMPSAGTPRVLKEMAATEVVVHRMLGRSAHTFIADEGIGFFMDLLPKTELIAFQTPEKKALLVEKNSDHVITRQIMAQYLLLLSKGIFCPDCTPENILLDAGRARAYLIDFDAVTCDLARVTEVKSQYFDRACLESLAGGEGIDAPGLLYSLGVTLAMAYPNTFQLENAADGAIQVSVKNELALRTDPVLAAIAGLLAGRDERDLAAAARQDRLVAFACLQKALGFPVLAMPTAGEQAAHARALALQVAAETEEMVDYRRPRMTAVASATSLQPDTRRPAGLSLGVGRGSSGLVVADAAPGEAKSDARRPLKLNLGLGAGSSRLMPGAGIDKPSPGDGEDGPKDPRKPASLRLG